MPRKNTYTWKIEVPMSSSLARRMAKQLAESTLKREGYTAEITVRELRPGEEPRLMQPPKDTTAAG